ncbi:MAG: hypothetical protein G01um101456_151 [Parcubacteria group bacterium Gr01-1014_56]|nr:MAG: hypothetical protein G01um101456_151 [Parcubacteria group bacterium Gr01-1014_56]
MGSAFTAVLDDSDKSKGNLSYELHGVLRVIPLIAKHLDNRVKLIVSIEAVCKRFQIGLESGLTGTLAAKAINALNEAEAQRWAESQ